MCDSRSRERNTKRRSLAGIISVRSAMLFVAGFVVSFSIHSGGDSLGAIRQQVFATEKVSIKHTDVSFPLILGDFTLEPIHLLEDNFVFQKQHCSTYKADRTFGCKIEWDEWMLVNAFVQPGDVVLEFGGRFGTTSCILSRIVGPTGAVVTVEPDELVHGFLLQNRFLHQCGFHALLGTVGAPQYRVGKAISNYGVQTSTTIQVDNAVAFPNMQLDEIETRIGRRVNVALIDCEGCIGSVDDAGVLDQVDLLLMEEDGWMSYNEWHKKLVDKGFTCQWYTKDTTAPHKEWSRNLRHSVWLRNSSNRTYPSCEDYVSSKIGTNNTGAIVCDKLPSTGNETK